MMNKAIDNLSAWFGQKGLVQEEFPYFIRDVIHFIDREGYASLQSLNQELEALGWGIQLMDESEYKQMLFLHRNKSFVT